jgi:signal transduction histidine kinase
VLTERGLAAAVEALAARSPLPVTIDASLERRLPEAQEVALSSVALEAIADVAKYAGARSDDGVGGADATAGSGLRGLADRVEALDGRLQLRQPSRVRHDAARAGARSR